MFGFLVIFLFGQDLILDVGIALTMDNREVIHNARIVISDGKIDAIGRQEDISLG